MDTLHRYYTVYNRFVANPSNLHFKIQYTEPDSDQNETTQFTNTDSLTLGATRICRAIPFSTIPT